MERQPSRPRLSSDDLELILSVTRHLAAPFELQALLGEVTAAACRVLRAERASVWLLDAAAGELVLRVASDLEDVRIAVGNGLVGSCAREGRLVNVPDCYADPRFDASVDRRSGFHTRCSLTVPLLDHRAALVGVIQVLNKRNGGVFGPSDEALAEALAAQCAVALSRVRLAADAMEAERLHHELDLAREVQASAMPHALPSVPGYDMHAVFLPAEETGGDAYDLTLGRGALLVMLADAAGHGVAPALAVTQLQAMVRMGFRLSADLETMFAQANDQLAETLPDGHFITAFVGLLDIAAHRLRFVSGGQSPILHYVAASDAFEIHRATSFPMGAMPMPGRPRAGSIDFEPGDVLLLLSDGIYEHEDAAGVQYGRGRVEQLVRQHASQAPAALCERLVDGVRQFAGDRPPQDDMTMVVLKRSAAG